MLEHTKEGEAREHKLLPVWLDSHQEETGGRLSLFTNKESCLSTRWMSYALSSSVLVSTLTTIVVGKYIHVGTLQ